ncbi:hypothetical protein ACQPW1_22360 [Nocardia sp. CA-128927]|uniref:hypothetical protein n=1 Tax=Nocardia sp. CA-128927 TaxID=3239975 RepID=UPI003D97BBA4
MAPNINTNADPRHGWGWLEPSSATILPDPMPDLAPDRDGVNPEWNWLDKQRSEPAELAAEPWDGKRRGLPRPAWIALGGVGVLAAVLVVGGAVSVNREQPAVAVPTMTAAPPASTIPASTACTGLSGATVTDSVSGDDPTTRAITQFEHAYYVERSSDAALSLLAPEAGITPEPLGAGIASIPLGTRHCVAITPIAPTVADVHLAELHPDGQRLDYLQVINVRLTAEGAVITNIQKKG